MKPWLEKNAIEMYWRHKEGKYVINERLIRTSKTKFTNIWLEHKKCIDDKYNNTYNSTIKIKPVDINPSSYIDFYKKNGNEGPIFKVGDNVTISKYKNVFAKGYFSNWSEEALVIKKVKNTVSWTGEKIVGTFYEKELQKTNQKEFRFKKVIKSKKKW